MLKSCTQKEYIGARVVVVHTERIHRGHLHCSSHTQKEMIKSYTERNAQVKHRRITEQPCKQS